MFVVGNFCVSDDITALNEELRRLRTSEGRSVENRQRESTLCVCVGGDYSCVGVCVQAGGTTIVFLNGKINFSGGGVKYILGGVRFP